MYPLSCYLRATRFPSLTSSMQPCISYLTIEHKGLQRIESPMGNRVFGCDDCQLVSMEGRYVAIGDPAFAKACTR